MAKEHQKVIAGIDTHADTHHVGVITDTGQHPAAREFPAAGSGYQGIIDFITGLGPVLAAGVEGTGSYGAELSRVLARKGIDVIEVMRPAGRPAGCRENPTRSMPTRPPNPYSPAAPPPSPNPATVQWNPCAYCAQSVPPPFGPVWP